MSHPTRSTSSHISLSQNGCRLLLDKAIEVAEQRGLRITVAVTDGSGVLLGFLRMDGAALVTVDVAIGKARTAAYLGAPSQIFEEMINAGQTAMVTAPNLLPLQGGVPVLSAGQVCGAIGVSGSSGENDRVLAEDVAAHFNF